MADDKVTINFEGKELTCRSGTSVAVALWENGIRHLSRSPKYGRPRGLTCARGHCTACLMRVDGVPNVRTCETPVREGLRVERQDPGAVYAPLLQKSLELGDAIFPVGFYYKWFTRPAVLSRFFLGRIRPLTGVGRLPDADAAAGTAAGTAAGEAPRPEDLGRYRTVIVGAGPSGLAAAAATASADAPVLLLDDHLQPGGQRRAALAAVAGAEGQPLDRFPLLQRAHTRLQDLLARVAAMPHVEFRGGWRAVAGYAPDGLVLGDGSRLATVRADRLIWTAGALDTLGRFAGNDTPGVLGPRALYRLLTRDGLELSGRRVLVVGGGLDLWLSACLLAAGGACLGLVVTESGWQSEVSAAVDRRWQLTTGLQLTEIKPHGPEGIEAIFTPESDQPGPLESHLRLQADLAVVCGRGKPVYDIPYQLGADLVLRPDAGGYVPRDPRDATGRGEAAGSLSLRIRGEADGTLPHERVMARREEETA